MKTKHINEIINKTMQIETHVNNKLFEKMNLLQRHFLKR